MMFSFFMAGIARWVALAAVIALSLGGLYVKGRIDGNASCLLTQQQQMLRMERYVKSIRERVERNLPLDDDILRTDPFQRDE